MSLKTRIRRLEQRPSGRSRVRALILNLPGSPPLMSLAGKWLPCDDLEVVRTNGYALKVYHGFDPRVALRNDRPRQASATA
jgi:hypothetical protein